MTILTWERIIAAAVSTLVFSAIASWRLSRLGGIAPQRGLGYAAAFLLFAFLETALLPGTIIGPIQVVLLVYLAVAAVTDLLANRVFLEMSAVALAIEVALALRFEIGYVALPGALICAFAGMVCYLSVYVVLRKEGFGLGDVILFGVVGAGFGPARGLAVIVAAFLLGFVIAVAVLVGRRSRLPWAQAPFLPFVPFVALGAPLGALFIERLRG